ncbi:MAG: TetR/AcrR family transcriptional regulator [Candidatus Thorarchaeota archaeon]
MNKKNEHSRKSPSRQRRELQRAQYRSQIISAAESLFLERGYERTNLKQVADKAGFVRATIYNYFVNGKDDLYLAVAANAFQSLCEYVEEGLNQSSPGDELLSMTTSYLNLARKQPARADIIDDVRLRQALAIIVEKESKNIRLTDDEAHFRNYQMKTLELLVSGVTLAVTRLKISGLSSPKIQEIAVAMSAIIPGWIKELVRRERFTHQTPDVSESQLKLIIGFFEKGIRSMN